MNGIPSGRAGVEVDAERGVEQRALGVVDGQRVARQQYVDEPGAGQPREIGGAAGVHDDRPGDERDATPGRLHLPHHFRDPRHADFDAALRRHVVGHEREVGAVAVAELRRDADAVEAADDAIAGPQVAELAAFGARGGEHDRRVHPLLPDVDPMPGDADLRPLVGG